MIKKIIAGMCCISFVSPSFAQPVVSDQTVISVYDKIVAANHLRRMPIVIVEARKDVCNPNEANAANSGKQIYVCRGLLNSTGNLPVRNEQELALILAHELAHSSPDVYRLPRKQVELGADKKGAEYASNAGFNICMGAQWIKRSGSGDDPSASDYHPSGEIRYRNLGC